MKERLTGAIILVALMVLLVPELLTGPIRSAPQAAAVSAPGEEPPLRSYTINLADDAHARNAGPGSAAPAQPAPLEAAPAPTPPVDAAPAEKPPATAESATTRAPEGPAPRAAPAQPVTASPANNAAGGLGTWVVQLGSFARRANAEKLARSVRAKGFKVSVSQESSGRRLYRVRVGPPQDRAAAGALAAQLQVAGHGGAVVPK